MTPPKALQIVARRLASDRDDVRHTLLDVSPQLLQLFEDADPQVWPPHLWDESLAVSREISEVQPRFPSHRTTSVLFDREGLGRTGRDRARRLADRIIALARDWDRLARRSS